MMGAVLALGGYGYIQSLGGWSEALKIPAKLDRSTPAYQKGFEFLGAARVTEDDRSPRLPYGDITLGGTSGAVGSTRIWFRLPPARSGQSPVPKDEDMSATIKFPDGEEYRARWEMAEISERIASLQIPAGHEPVDALEVRIADSQVAANWRLIGLPKVPRAIPEHGDSRFRAEGLQVSARARHRGRWMLNVEPMSRDSYSGMVELAIDGKDRTPDGLGLRATFDRFIPEYRHRADVEASQGSTMLVAGERVRETVPMTFPYVDRDAQIGVSGEIQAIETSEEPITFENVRWQWGSIGPSAGQLIWLVASPVKLANRLEVELSATNHRGSPILSASVRIVAEGGSFSLDPNVDVVALRFIDTPNGGFSRACGLRGDGTKAGELRIGRVQGVLRRRKVVRSTPFELVVPVSEAKWGDSMSVPVRKLPVQATSLFRPSATTSGISAGR